MNTFRVKSMISRVAQHFGYRIERIVEDDEHPLDLFEVLVERLQQERGDAFFFVQVGAHDGKSDDPIRKYVEAFHWHGILVEPQPEVFA